MIRHWSERLLYAAECLFLIAHGWYRDVAGDWVPPVDYPGKQYARDHGHAVNSQRFYSRNPLMQMAARWESRDRA